MFCMLKQISDSKFLYFDGTDYVLASHSSAFTTPEVLLFKSDVNGEVLDWSEVYGEKLYEVTDYNVVEAIQETVDRFNRLNSRGDYNGAWF